MGTFLFGVFTGLIIGWNALPQPAFVKDFYEKTLAKAKELLNS